MKDTKKYQKGFISTLLVAVIAITSLAFAGITAKKLNKNVVLDYDTVRDVDVLKDKVTSNQYDIYALENSVYEVKQEIKSQPQLSNNQALGDTNDIPTVVALFETTLASSITTTATTMTLTSATDKEGNTLASSTYAFIIDEGTASEEMVIADCTGTACTNMTRGISVLSGTSTVASLRKTHRRGASVKITDGPQLMILSRMANGIGAFPNLMRYKSGTNCVAGSDGQTICDKTYMDNLTNQGAATATESVSGISELATKTEMASSTDNGSNNPLVLQAKNATSSPMTFSGSGNTYVVVTQDDGTINENFIATTSDYVYTGKFTADNLTSTVATSTSATTTNLSVSSGNLGVNGIDWNWPSSDVASSSAFLTDGNENIILAELLPKSLLVNTASTTHTGDTATTTLLSYTLAANELRTNNLLKISFFCQGSGGSSVKGCEVAFGTGSASTTIAGVYGNLGIGGGFPGGGYMELTISNVNSQTSQKNTAQSYLYGADGASVTTQGFSNTSARDTSSELFISISGRVANSSHTIHLQGVNITKY